MAIDFINQLQFLSLDSWQFNFNKVIVAWKGEEKKQFFLEIVWGGYKTDPLLNDEVHI